ncbi:MAG: hypothetical protein NC489_25980 [Ruminococcus flavefaciens]|nr:hypothetical protein [Ruminococcus flavefaciens]
MPAPIAECGTADLLESPPAGLPLSEEMSACVPSRTRGIGGRWGVSCCVWAAALPDVSAVSTTEPETVVLPDMCGPPGLTVFAPGGTEVLRTPPGAVRRACAPLSGAGFCAGA